MCACGALWLPHVLVLQAGSTCTVATVFGDALVVANVGDSDAILCRKGVPHMLSFQHKASDESERQRIIAGGGSVYVNFGSWRVSGMLEVPYLDLCSA
jgi:protein phosphatase 2C